MELMQGYKQTDIGLFPRDWSIKKLKEITTLLTNGFVGSAKIHYSENDSDVLYIQGYNVLENSFDFHGIKHVTRSFHSQHQKSSLLENDLLTVQTGDVGLTTIVPKGLVGSNCHALIITRYKKNLVDSKYISFFLNSKQGRMRLKLIETGTTMKHLNCGDMLEFQLPLPPLSEQISIANALSDMDALIAQTEKLIEKKKAIKQGVMQELLKPKEGWVTKSFSEIFVKYPSKNYQINSYNYKDSGLFPVIDQGKSKIVAYSDDASKLFNCPQQGIIVFGDHTRIFKYINFDFLIGADGTQLLTTKDGYNTLFLYYILINREIPNTGYNRHFKFLKEMMFKLPISLESQTSISGKLLDMDSEILILESKSKKLKQQKQGMMQALLTGKIRLL